LPTLTSHLVKQHAPTAMYLSLDFRNPISNKVQPYHLIYSPCNDYV